MQRITKINGKLVTLNSAPGFRVYNEKLIRRGGKEYRIWDPFRSKLSAALVNGLKELPINERSNVLYLGASAGTTAGHVADITSGIVYCVEFSKRMMRELMTVCERKRNMMPILADANFPERYAHGVGRVDVIYQDVAQPNQAEILLKNAEFFKPKFALLAIKSRSIDAVKDPKKVFNEEIEKLKGKFEVLQVVDLKPYDEDHVLVSLRTTGR